MAKNELWNQMFLGLNLILATYKSLRELTGVHEHPQAVLFKWAE